MALVVLNLRNRLSEIFESMRSDNGNDEYFAENISLVVKDYAESGTINTTDGGAISAGTFVGAGAGGISCNASICENIVLNACREMRSMTTGGDAYLALQLSTAINSMVLAGVVECSVTGTVTTPSGVSSPISGTSRGTAVGVPAPMQASFLSAFNAMAAMTSGGDEFLAAQIASGIDAYLKACVVSTLGQGAISGSAGAGAMV